VQNRYKNSLEVINNVRALSLASTVRMMLSRRRVCIPTGNAETSNSTNECSHGVRDGYTIELKRSGREVIGGLEEEEREPLRNWQGQVIYLS
jgi:hypothetical protein